MIKEFRKMALEMAPELIAIRRHLHENPELSYQERKTASYISEMLSRWNIPHRTGVGGYGIVADLAKDGLTPKVALRADMDALPIEEAIESPFVSRVAGVAHLCGHDAHVAMLLGAIKLLIRRFGEGGIPVRLLFQPAEEVPPGGAEALIQDGALQGVRAIAALHVARLPVGTFGIRSGAITASVDRFEAVITGKGCHGAMPHLGIDPVVMAAGIVQAMQTLISRSKDPLEAAVLTIGRLHAGSQYNIIPEEAILEGTLRTFSKTVREDILRRAETIIKDYPPIFGGEGSWRQFPGHGNVINDLEMTRFAMAMIREGWGEEALVEVSPQSFGEDFANYGTSARLLLTLIGAGDEAMFHSPRFDLDENVLPEGAAFLAALGVRMVDEIL